MFYHLIIIIKKFNSINSRRPWPPILISHFFSMAFIDCWLPLFYTRGVLFEIKLFKYLNYACVECPCKSNCILETNIDRKVTLTIQKRVWITFISDITTKCTLIAWTTLTCKVINKIYVCSIIYTCYILTVVMLISQNLPETYIH